MDGWMMIYLKCYCLVDSTLLAWLVKQCSHAHCCHCRCCCFIVEPTLKRTFIVARIAQPFKSVRSFVRSLVVLSCHSLTRSLSTRRLVVQVPLLLLWTVPKQQSLLLARFGRLCVLRSPLLCFAWHPTNQRNERTLTVSGACNRSAATLSSGTSHWSPEYFAACLLPI